MAPKPFSAELRQYPGAVVIDLHGEINAFAEKELNAAYTAAETNNPASVLLNFKGVHYMNSTGIALIVGLMSRARKNHRSLVVSGLSDHYAEIFKITRLSDFMTIYPDETAALSAMVPQDQ